MGKSTVIHYVLKIRCSDGHRYRNMEWVARSQPNRPSFGKPTVENIDKWVTDFEKSRLPGGTNQHLGYATVISAEIYDQFKGVTVAEWDRKTQRPNEPKFEVVF